MEPGYDPRMHERIPEDVRDYRGLVQFLVHREGLGPFPNGVHHGTMDRILLHADFFCAERIRLLDAPHKTLYRQTDDSFSPRPSAS